MDNGLQLELEEGPEQRRRFVLLLVVRAAVISALLGSTIFFNIRRGLPGFSLTQILLYGVAASVLVLTTFYVFWLRRRRGPLGLHLQVQILFDVVAATLLVYITGGVESPFTFFYALPIIHTAVFFPRRRALLTAGLSCLCLGALFILESRGVLPIDLEGRVMVPPSTLKVVYLLGFNYAVFVAIAWLAGSLGEQLRRTGAELRESEEEVEALTALNRDIVLSLRSGLMATGIDGRVTLVNPVAEQILGCKAAEAMGQPWESVFPSLDGVAELAPVADGTWPDASTRLEVDHRRKTDGLVVPVGLTISPLARMGGGPSGALVHMQDLTVFKAMERSMKHAERMAALGGMAAVIAHEIRNPLASLSGSVQMLQRSAGSDSAEGRLMQIIVRETERLDSLLTDFLAYARPREPRMERVQLDELVTETLAVFAQRDGEPLPEVTCEVDEAMVQVDPAQFRQVLWNLLANAVDAAAAKEGRVGIRVKRLGVDGDSRSVVLEVSDNGPGIPEGERERVFEPFFTTKEKGSGLGLATVGQIVEAHGASIEVECPDEGGSLFRVRLREME